MISGTYRGNVNGTSYTQELKDESLGYLFDSSTHAGKAVFEMSAGCCGWIRMDITIITAITITLIMTGSRGWRNISGI